MPSHASLPPVWVRGIITWLVYTLSGLLAITLTAPSDHVSPVYLAAGVALACVIGWGPWMLIAVGLGAGTLSLITTSTAPLAPGWPIAVALAGLSGTGAALQAGVAARLTRPRDGEALILDTPGQIGVFLALAGPVSCLIHPMLSVLASWAMGVMPATEAPQTLVGWWIGDTLGVVIGTPMLLTLVGQPRELWRQRRDVVGIPLLIATVLLGVAVRQVQSWRVEREAAVFHQDVTTTTNAVNLRLNSYLDALAALSGVFEASDNVSRSEFARASRYWVQNLQGIQAVGWAERLFVNGVPAFEATQRAEGVRNFKVFDAASGQPPRGPELAVLRYIEPRDRNEGALGYNVLSAPISRAAYEQARREGHVTVSGRLKLIQEKGAQFGVVVYHPVYQGQPYTPQTRVQANLGAVFLSLRLDDALSAMLQGKPGYLDACLLDNTDERHTVLAGSKDCLAGRMGQGSPYRETVPLDFGGRQWQLLLWNARPIPVIGLGATTWMLAVGGVAFAAALGSLLLVMTGHTRRIEAAMDEARRQRAAAETANRAKSEFLSRMSHELRTPLNAVLGFAQIMDMDPQAPLPPVQKQRVSQIQQAGWHLLDMIDDVLDVSRIDTDTMRLKAEPLRIRDELAKTLKLMGGEARQRHVTLSIEGDIPAEWGVLADAARLHQILGNLIDNAIKFNRPNGRILLKVTQVRAADGIQQMQLAVQDTGIGMNDAQVAQLFQPFNRLGREQTQINGAGIGLVVSRHLAMLMGGQLDVSSVEGQGSTFTLSLPAVSMPASVAPSPTTAQRPKPAAAPAAIDTPAPDVRSAPAARHVLYVEDNEANSELIRAALGARPWIKVSVAPTTEEGLAVLHNRLLGSKPDLILLDVHLPDASGQELLRLIKANPDTSSIPVIMISADALPEQIDAALAAGANCYMTKPVQLTELLRQVDELMPT